MNFTAKYITLAVHTREAALKLKESLEFHDIKVMLEPLDNVGIQPVPFRVKIPLDSLHLGIKILESGDLNLKTASIMEISGMSNILLIPVDFSDSSILAVKVGFYLAKKLGLSPVLLNAFVAPLISPANPFGPALDDTQIEEAREDVDLQNLAQKRMTEFSQLVDAQRKNRKIADCNYETVVQEGVPEQVILDYAKSNKPILIVMATRGIHKKGMDLVGSVTAEVIDACRVPVLTVPDNYGLLGVENIKRVLFLCSMSRFDLIAIRSLMRTFDFPSCDIFLAASPNSNTLKHHSSLESLRTYCDDVYPTASFHIVDSDSRSFDDKIKQLLDSEDIQIIIAPNRKSSALARFFHPTLSHKILFEKDIPLLSLPYSPRSV